MLYVTVTVLTFVMKASVSASDSFSTMALYKSIYLLTYLNPLMSYSCICFYVYCVPFFISFSFFTTVNS